MKKNLVIFVVGDSDHNLSKLLLIVWNIEVEDIIHTGGYKKRMNYKKEIIRYNERDTKILVLFDADYADSNDVNSAYKHKVKYLKTRHGVEFDIYLFPDNTSDGTLENFIKDVARHKRILSCRDRPWECVESQNSDKIKFSMEGSKTMLYFYMSRLFASADTGSKKMKAYQKNIDFGDDKWEIEKSDIAKKLNVHIENT